MKMATRFGLVCLLAVFGALSVRAEEPAKKKYKMLFITQSKGFMHGSVKRKEPAILSPSEVAVTDMAAKSGLFDVECSQDASIITAEKLKDLDIVMFYTTGALPISPENFTAFETWLKSGKGFIGTHSATDTFGGFKPYYEMINGTFDGHPWGSGTKVTVTNHDPEHPTVKMWGPEFVIQDEIYQYKNYDPKAVRVLLSLNMEKCSPKMPYFVPLCWVREVGQGRLFYTNLGHNEATWVNPKFQEHLLAGIRYVLKLENGDATPNPDVQAATAQKNKSLVLPDFKAPITEAATLCEMKGDDVYAAVEKLDDVATHKFVNDFNGIRGEKDPAKKKERLAKLFAGLK